MNAMQSDGKTTQRDEQGRIVPRAENDPEAKVNLPGVGWFAEYEETEARRNYSFEIFKYGWFRSSWESGKLGQVCLELYDKFQEYKRLVTTTNEHKPGLLPPEVPRYPEHQLFSYVLVAYEEMKAEQDKAEAAKAEAEREQHEKAMENLAKAKDVERCHHVHADGQQCGSPKMKEHTLCYMHARMEQAKARKLDLGPMEDADSIQLGIKKLQAAVIDGTLEDSQVRQLAYLIRLAAWNVKGTTFGSRQDIG